MTGAAPSPDEAVRQMRAAYDQAMEGWAKVMEDWVGSDAFAENSGRMLQQYLEMQEQMRAASRVSAGRLDLPTIDDIARLAQLIANVERKVDEVSDHTHAITQRLDAIEAALSRGDPPAPEV